MKSLAERCDALRALRKARALIRKGWTQSVFARNSKGREVLPQSSLAVRWCLLGALDAATYTSDMNVWFDAIHALGFRNVITAEWNDDPKRTKAQVLARFDKTIARLEA